MLRLPARLKLLNPEGEWETAEDDLVSNETMEKETSQLANNDNFNAGTDSQDDGDTLSFSSSMMTSSAGEHPLLYPEILQHLFQLCPASILAPCRLVCKLWYEESLLPWQSSVPITVKTDHDETNVNVGVGRVIPLKEFLEDNNQSGSQCSTKTYRNIRILQSCNCPPERELDEFSESEVQKQRMYNPKRKKLNIRRCKSSFCSKDLGIFWESIGSNLTTLTLSGCTFSNVEEFRQIIYKCCPILQKLEIDGWTILSRKFFRRDENNGQNKHLKSLIVRFGRYQLQLPVSWIELFSRFPSLTSLECSAPFSREFPGWEVEKLTKAIRAIRRDDTNQLPLKYFQIHPHLPISRDTTLHHRFDLVKELRLPLNGCSIEVHPEMDTTFVTTTLQDLAPFVKEITLFLEEEVRKAGQVMVPALSQDFPYGIQLDNLTRLESRGDLIGTFEFLKYTPNLCSLDISDGDGVLESGGKLMSSTMAISNTCEETLGNLQMARLTTLKLGFRLRDEDIIRLSKWMPNITNLKMVLNDQQFGMVCRKWRNLRELTVFGDSCDKLLTEESVTGINKRKKIGIRPDIANLECLESLVLEVLRLTPESVYYLFLQLPTLRILLHEYDGWDTVKRGDLDISSYQRAIQRCSCYATNVSSTPLPKLLYNVVKQWIAENSNGVKEMTTDCD